VTFAASALVNAADALLRTLALLAVGLAPALAPFEPRPSASPGEAAWRLALGLGALAALGLGARAAVRRSPPAAGLAAATFVATVGGAFYFRGGDGPLARGAWLVSPLAWSAVAAVVYARRAACGRRSPRAARAAAVAGPAIAAILLSASWRHLGSREALWRSSLAADAGDADAAIAYGGALDRAGRRGEAARVLAACAAAAPCRCAAPAASAALERGEFGAALATIDRALASCGRGRALGALRGEALAGLGDPEGAAAEADDVLRAEPEQPRALYAKARALRLRERPEARAFAARAVAAGRGYEARLLLGLLLFEVGDLEAAANEFRAAAASAPDRAAPHYDLALVAHQQNRYREAREGYLRALSLDPGHLNARYNLSLLTHAAGADLEAAHHLDLLRRAAPDDARLAALERALGAGAPTAPAP
jgi:tetratricopeptide (TPR) repeat protein